MATRNIVSADQKRMMCVMREYRFGVDEIAAKMGYHTSTVYRNIPNRVGKFEEYRRKRSLVGKV